MRSLVTTFLCVILCITSALAKPHRHSKKPSQTSLPALAPTHSSLVQQNQIINQYALLRVTDEAELKRIVQAGRLTALPQTNALKIAPSLPANRRYALPHVVSFLEDISEEFNATFESALQVNSAVRPVTVQKRLRRFNRNAAPIHGETASSHEAGCTVDLARRTLTKAQQHWLEFRLMYYMYAQQRVLVEEERACFHIMVVPGDF